jgi:arylsulfatase A-like enzyme
MNLLCLAIDSLRPDFLGCYGNTWIATPTVDHLAAEGFLFDQVTLDSADLREAYTSLWTGGHALRRILMGSDKGVPPDNLPAEASRLGWNAALITDEPGLARHALADGFAERIEVAPDAFARPARSPDETQSAALFAAAAEWLESATEPFFLWGHSRGMAGAWDAPYEYRERYAAEEDPRPPHFIDPPCETSARDFDPDHLLGIRQAYAGQMTLLGEHLGSLLEALRAAGRLERTLLVFLGTRGFPLGLHRRIGADEGELVAPSDDSTAPEGPAGPPWSESTHVPLLFRIPEPSGIPANLVRGARSQALVQPGDLRPTLSAWLQAAQSQPNALPPDLTDRLLAAAVVEAPRHPAAGASLWPVLLAREESLRDRVVTSAGAGLVLRTRGWSLRLSSPQAPSALNAETMDAWLNHPEWVELFVRPDDRHEVNNVAQVCPEIVEKMTASLRDFVVACRQKNPPPLPALPPELLHGP